MNMKYTIDEYSNNETTTIKVIGVGGGGCNAIEHMCKLGMKDVHHICINTDAQVLQRVSAKVKMQLGSDITRGQGAGANPDVGRQAAIEDRERIVEVLNDCDMVFITCGMGGGTGTGAAPIIAEVAKERDILTVAVVTKPFKFEGVKRMEVAERGIAQLREYVDSLIIIQNDKLLSVYGEDCSFINAFAMADEVLYGAVNGISELITRPGLINVDFADVCTVMSARGVAMMGFGQGRGEERAKMATEFAISSPLLEDVNLRGAQGILINVIAGRDLTLKEFTYVNETIGELASEDATIVIGSTVDEEMSGEIRVTLVATGLEQPQSLHLVEDNRDSRSEVETVEPVKDAVGYRGSLDKTSPDYLDIPAFLRNQAD